jgi:hypothetical protein
VSQSSTVAYAEALADALASQMQGRGEYAIIEQRDEYPVTLWGNDLPLPLSQNAKRAPSAIASFARRFSSILRQLRVAAPNAEIIVTGAWNPEADRLARSEALYRLVDGAMRRSATASRARIANMFTALDGPGNFKAQKARLCALTFVCSKGDPHPTDAGYRAMEDAFMSASGYARKR